MSLKSIYFYPPLPPSVHLRGPGAELPFPLGDERTTLFARGRHAIWHAASALRLKPGERVLVPAWHHGAEIEALRRAGLELDFYELGPSLEPDADELDALIRADTRMLFLTHYLGFAQDVLRWRAWCDERRLLLFEDAAHACLSRLRGAPLGAFGDAAVWCLFKSFPVPDGAALRLRRGEATPTLDPERGTAAAARCHAQWLLQRAPFVAAAAWQRNGNGAGFDLQAEIALGQPGSPPLEATQTLLPRVASDDAGRRRRANYRALLDELGDQVPEPFRVLPNGTVPLGLPLETGSKRALLDRLEQRGVDAVDFWSVPHPVLPGDGFEQSARRRASTVLLPVHQGLRQADLERIATAARRLGAPRRPELHVESAESVRELEDEWSQLAHRGRNVFATPEWTATWCAHFLGGRPLELLAFRSASGRLVGVMPAYEYASRPRRILRLAGHGPGEDLGPLCAPEDGPQVARALVRALDERGGALLVAEQVSAEAGWGALTGGHTLRSEPSPAILPAPGGWEAFLAGRSRRLRKEMRRQQRRIDLVGGVEYRRGGQSAQDLQRELGVLFELHDSVFGEESRFSQHAGFHRDFAETARRRGWLRLWFLDVGGKTVAAWYGFRYAGVEFDYQGGRDRDWDDFAVGNLVIAHALSRALDDGVDEYRLLRGAEPYKQRLATHDRGVETLVIGGGPVGSAAALAAAALPKRLTAVAKRRLAA